MSLWRDTIIRNSMGQPRKEDVCDLYFGSDGSNTQTVSITEYRGFYINVETNGLYPTLAIGENYNISFSAGLKLFNLKDRKGKTLQFHKALLDKRFLLHNYNQSDDYVLNSKENGWMYTKEEIIEDGKAAIDEYIRQESMTNILESGKLDYSKKQ